MMKQSAVRLPEATYTRLHTPARKTGRTATFYIREAIERHLEGIPASYHHAGTHRR